MMVDAGSAACGSIATKASEPRLVHHTRPSAAGKMLAGKRMMPGAAPKSSTSPLRTRPIRSSPMLVNHTSVAVAMMPDGALSPLWWMAVIVGTPQTRSAGSVFDHSVAALQLLAGDDDEFGGCQPIGRGAVASFEARRYQADVIEVQCGAVAQSQTAI